MPWSRCCLLLFCAACGRAAEAPAPWSGTIEIVEALSGRASNPADKAELDRLIATTEDRRRWARLEIPTLPPVMAAVAANDLGVLDSELERSILARGGEPFPVGRTRYTIARGRILVESEQLTVLVDRNRNLAWIRSGGQIEERRLEPLEEPEAASGAVGPELFGRTTVTAIRRIDGRDHLVTWLPDVPNPYALARIDVVGPHSGADLAADLARLPGLPALVISDLGTVILQLNVVQLEERPVPESVFAPPKP